MIKLGPKVYPNLSDNQQSTKSLITDFVLPIYEKVTVAKSSQTSYMGKLINLVNSKALVDFMSELFCTMQDLYPRYAGQASAQALKANSCKMMTFDQFATFARDYDIFPRFCSKPALYRIFHTLSQMREALKPDQSVQNMKRLLQ